MAVEIERKFRVNADKLPALPSPQQISQGYLGFSPEVRVRLMHPSNRAFITVKYGTGIRRDEFEYEIPFDDARVILSIPGMATILKQRYTVMESGRTWTIDEYLQNLQGLWIGEIELEDEHERFRLPSWISREVTGAMKYSNQALAKTEKLAELEGR